MSRSFKKYPIVRQEKENHKFLNRRIRHDKYAELNTPGAYRKHSRGGYSWNHRWTKEEAIKNYYEDERIQNRYSLEDWLNYWKNCVIRK